MMTKIGWRSAIRANEGPLVARRPFMNPMRWDPFIAMDEMFGRFPSPFNRWPLSRAVESSPAWAPYVDISETGQEYLLRAALPDVKKEDVKITLEDGMLTLSGERRRREEQRSEKFHRIENHYGAFSRSFVVPDTIDRAAIHAESKEGVLTIHLPKSAREMHRPTTIRVQ
jgi:HSP20 family protein